MGTNSNANVSALPWRDVDKVELANFTLELRLYGMTQGHPVLFALELFAKSPAADPVAIHYFSAAAPKYLTAGGALPLGVLRTRARRWAIAVLKRAAREWVNAQN